MLTWIRWCDVAWAVCERTSTVRLRTLLRWNGGCAQWAFWPMLGGNVRNHAQRAIPVHVRIGEVSELAGMIAAMSDREFPPSPVPGDRPELLWPGELPFTAFGQWGPDRLDLRVFDQDVYWVDRFGTPHRLDDMGVDYLANVVMHLRENRQYFFIGTLRRHVLQIDGDLELGRTPAQPVTVPRFGEPLPTPEAWLDGTPLMRRLLELLSVPPPADWPGS